MRKITAALLCLVTVLGLLPLFFTEADAAFTGADKINIVLDPGHGGYNVGAAAGGVSEKNHTFKLAQYLKAELDKNGSFNVYLTRTGDYDLELYQRAEVANNYNADLLISLHFDGNPSPSVNGVTTYTSVFDSYAAVSLSSSIASKVSAAVGLANNGVRRRADTEGYYWSYEKQWDCQDPSLGVLSDYYGIPTWCAKFGIKSIIVEHGYFSNAGDIAKVRSDEALQKIAKAEAEAIIAYYTNHVHVYSSPTRDFPSNCVYTGKQSERCSLCGHRKNVSLIAPAPDNHYWVTKENVPASCGTDGRCVKECRITQNLCDKGWTGQLHTETTYTPAPTDHTFELVEHVEATHTVDGYKKWKCKTCTYSFKDILKAEGHSYEFVGYTEPTCTKSGGNTYKCTACGHSYTDTEPAKGHSFEVVGTTAPTCTENGQRNKKCTVCSFETADLIPALGHDLPPQGCVEPTCTEDGYNKGTCKRCGTEIDETVPKKGHNFSTATETPATCTAEGKRTSVCSICGYEKISLIAMLDHTFGIIDKVSPTCEKEGNETRTCTLCQKTEVTELAATGHERSKEGTVTKKPGLFTEGKMEYPCKNGCGKTFSEDIPPTISKKTLIIAIGLCALLISSATTVAVIIFEKKSRRSKDGVVPVIPADGIKEESEGDQSAKSPEETDAETCETEAQESEAQETEELPVGE